MNENKIIRVHIILVIIFALLFLAVPGENNAQETKNIKKKAKKIEKRPNAVLSEKKSKPAEKLARAISRSRKYIIYQGEQVLGFDAYNCSRTPSGVFGTSEIEIKSLAPVKMRQLYSLNPETLALKQYELLADAAGEKQRVTCTVDGSDVRIFSDVAGATKETLLRCQPPLYLLDNMNGNNFQFVIDSYSHKNGGVQIFKAVVPQRMAIIELRVENLGFVKGKFDDRRVEFLKYRAVENDTGQEMFIYALNDGTLAALVIPARRYRVSLDGFFVEREEALSVNDIKVIGAVKAVESSSYFTSKDNVKIFSKYLAPMARASGASNTNYPAVVLIADSGPLDCDGNSASAKINNLKNIAEYLVENGIASLRYDKRNAGRSDMSGDSPFSDYVADALNAYKYLASKSGVDSSAVYLLGHSEGALIAMSAVSKIEKAGGLILLAAQYQPFDKILISQVKADLEYGVSLSSKDRYDYVNQLTAVLDSMKKGTVPKINSVSVPSMEALLKSLVNQPKFIMGLLGVDPAKLANAVKVPTLLIGAEFDMQVPLQNYNGLANVFEKNKIKFKKAFIKRVNHVFKRAASMRDTASYFSAYGVSNQVLNAISSFILDFNR